MKFTVMIVVLLCLPFASAHAAAPSVPIKPSQIVTVAATTDGADPCDPQEALADLMMNPDGTVSPFTIPAGKVLVITSAEWVAVGALPEKDYRLSIIIEDASVVFGAGSLSDSNGDVSGSLQVPSGFVVKPGTALCISAKNFSENHKRPAFTRLHGYFAKDE